MGWCHEFGVEIEPACGHPMTAGRSQCACNECGVVCPGRFEGGCEAVWRQGPRHGAQGRPSPVAAAGPPRLRTVGGEDTGIRLEPAASIPVVNGSATDLEGVIRVKALQVALANLAEQVADQTRQLGELRRHVTDLSRVLGQLGVEVDDRVGNVERAIDSVRAPLPER